MASNEALGVPSELSDTSFNKGIETETTTEGVSFGDGLGGAAGMGGATGASGASAAAGMGGASGAEFSGKDGLELCC